MKKRTGFTISIGELIDRLSIANVKVWKAEEAMSKTINKHEIADYALMIRAMNRERSELREEINSRLEGRTRGTTKLGYPGLGRDK